MKGRPILFSGAMVRAILAGTKTQTRRVVKIKPPLCNEPYYPTGKVLTDLVNQPGAFMEFRYTDQRPESASFLIACPYGQPGDALWVRETWRTHSTKHDRIAPRNLRQGEHIIHYDATMNFIAPFLGKGRPSIFMPRWACRLTLRIKSVRVERLNSISEEDAKAEGVTNGIAEHVRHPRSTDFMDNLEIKCKQTDGYWKNFRTLWDSINAKRAPWASNPWTWVVEFERA